MSRPARALQNAGLAVGIFLAYVVAGILAVGFVDGAQIFWAAAGIALLFGAPSMFILALVFDAVAGRLHHRMLQRALAVALLLGGAVVFSLEFEDYLARNDPRAVLGWLTIPPACIYGLLVRLPPVASGADARRHGMTQAG
jgi:hypothetical protein